MSFLVSISTFLSQSVQKSMKHRCIATPCSWIIVSHMYILTREIIYLSRCVCYRSIRHIIAPVVERLLVVLLLHLPPHQLLPLCPLCCHSCWCPASVIPATVAVPSCCQLQPSSSYSQFNNNSPYDIIDCDMSVRSPGKLRSGSDIFTEYIIHLR